MGLFIRRYNRDGMLLGVEHTRDGQCDDWSLTLDQFHHLVNPAIRITVHRKDGGRIVFNHYHDHDPNEDTVEDILKESMESPNTEPDEEVTGYDLLQQIYNHHHDRGLECDCENCIAFLSYQDESDYDEVHEFDGELNDIRAKQLKREAKRNAELVPLETGGEPCSNEDPEAGNDYALDAEGYTNIDAWCSIHRQSFTNCPCRSLRPIQ